jgi:hypothetical protein
MHNESMNYEDLPPDHFPLPSDDLPSCGNRKDLFKKQRVHAYVYLGRDVRHGGEKGWAIEMDVYACAKCGRDVSRTIRRDT